ncbi:hypothetical protein ACLSU7_18060 [Bdellovibrio sp. HCB185ZH]|uniref:hypothetical protein n=1 Tax=Bdellovibrio sp. HCB185ZH TaxID=3394235 RepID=UPI0039A6B396
MFDVFSGFRGFASFNYLVDFAIRRVRLFVSFYIQFLIVSRAIKIRSSNQL